MLELKEDLLRNRQTQVDKMEFLIMKLLFVKRFRNAQINKVAILFKQPSRLKWNIQISFIRNRRQMILFLSFYLSLCLSKYTYLHCPSPAPSTPCAQSLPYHPVCGIPCLGIPQTFNNSCQACSNPNITTFISGICIDQVLSCPFYRPPCNLRSDFYVHEPSCAFEQGKPPRNIKTSLCCNNETYSYVLAETCPIMKSARSPGVSWCPKKRPKDCAKVRGAVVCGVYVNRDRQEFDNWCLACKNPYVSVYMEGLCPKTRVAAAKKIYTNPSGYMGNGYIQNLGSKDSNS